MATAVIAQETLIKISSCESCSIRDRHSIPHALVGHGEQLASSETARLMDLKPVVVTSETHVGAARALAMARR